MKRGGKPPSRVTSGDDAARKGKQHAWTFDQEDRFELILCDSNELEQASKFQFRQEHDVVIARGLGFDVEFDLKGCIIMLARLDINGQIYSG